MAFKVGVDIGGTFTDLFAYDRETGESICMSSSSTPENYANGVLNVIDKAGIDYSDIEIIIHGTTVATNAVIMGNYEETAFVTTDGMRDLIEIGRFHRKGLYDPYQKKPSPIVRRHDRYTVKERISKDGETITPLDEQSVIDVAKQIKEKGIKAIAVGTMNSYVNSTNERKIADILKREIPDAYVVNSETILPTIGALGRFTTAIINASLYHLVGTYIESLQSRLYEKGFRGILLLVQSNGGAITAEMVKTKPETLLMSGPAGGVVGALQVGEEAGFKDIITFDMGGTSADISIIENSKPFVTTDVEIDWDMPVPIPIVEVLSIGAGGGSVAWVDSGGALKVGPKSAGAKPGPACYGLGGTEPTVTDANLVLGYLDPEAFLGGDMKLDVEAAKKAISELGKKIGLSMYDTAKGIIEIVNENMANAVKEVTIGKGRDPRDFALSAFGGAGSLHAVAVSDKVGVPKVIVPPEPGNLCAFGDINMDLQTEVSRFFYSNADDVDIDSINSKFDEMDHEGVCQLEQQQVACREIRIRHMAAMRYVGQSYEIEIPCPSGQLTAKEIKKLKDDFNETHKKMYFVCDPDSDVEITKLRSTVIGVIAERLQLLSTKLEEKVKMKTVEAYFDGRPVETTVYERRAIDPTRTVSGPAIVREGKASTVIPPGKICEINPENGSMIITNKTEGE